MPRYFFLLKSAVENAEDAQGELLPDDAAAHRHAQQTARELGGGRYRSAVIVVRCEDGRMVTEVPIDQPLS
jgi:hypothetical protein